MKILILLLCLSFSGCATSTPHQSIYQKQLAEIEQAYNDKKITYAEYLNLKDNVEDARQQRKSTIASAYLSRH